MNDSMGIYKPDWRESRQRMIDWWEGRKVDRAVASVTAPLNPSSPKVSAYIPKVPDKYVDFNTVFNNLDYRLERCFWGAEAFPRHFVYFGPMFILSYLGCEPHFAENTTWYEPCFESLDGLLDFEFDRSNRWWTLQKEMLVRSMRRSEGRYVCTIGGAISSMIDVIAGTLGNEKLLISMMDEPDKLKAARDRIAAWGVETHKEMFDIADEFQDGGTIDWLGIWCHKKAQTAQCDMSVMISPEMFRDYVKGDLEATYGLLDYGMYHLDGEDQIKHLDILLSIEKLRLIQWVPSPKVDRDPLKWIDFFRRIQDAGKSVMIYCPPERVGALLRKIARDKVFLSVDCPDLKSAQTVLSEIGKAGA